MSTANQTRTFTTSHFRGIELTDRDISRILIQLIKRLYPNTKLLMVGPYTIPKLSELSTSPAESGEIRYRAEKSIEGFLVSVPFLAFEIDFLGATFSRGFDNNPSQELVEAFVESIANTVTKELNPLYSKMLSIRNKTIESILPLIAKPLLFEITEKLVHYEDTTGEGTHMTVMRLIKGCEKKIAQAYVALSNQWLPFHQEQGIPGHLDALVGNVVHITMTCIGDSKYDLSVNLTEYLVHHVRQRLWQLPINTFINAEERAEMISEAVTLWSGFIPPEIAEKAKTDYSQFVVQTNVDLVIKALSMFLAVDIMARDSIKAFGTRCTEHAMEVEQHPASRCEAHCANWVPADEPLQSMLNTLGIGQPAPLDSLMQARLKRYT